MKNQAVEEKRVITKPSCPHLMKSVIPSCRAADEPYAPSPFQMTEYCRTRNHRKCPFFMNLSKPAFDRSVEGWLVSIL